MILDENLFNFTGRIGDYVVYWYRGKKCIRKRPKAPKGPPTPGMVTQQKRMQSASIFYHALKKAGIYPYWQKAAEGKVENGYNLITKVNMSAFDGEGQICDFTKLHPTPRLLASPNGMTLSPTGDSMWKLTWKNSPNTGCTGDEDLLQEVFEKYPRIITLEDGVLAGGLASAVSEFAVRHHYTNEIHSIGIPDRFIPQGSIAELQKLCGMDPESIAELLLA